PNFGSEHVVHLRRPAIALAWDRPVSSGSAGAVRFILERQYGYPVTAIRTAALAAADLSRFQVLILPEGGQGYAAVLGPNGIRSLKDWVAAGGTLIGFGSTVSFLADPKVALLAVAQESLARPDGESARKPDTKPEPDNRVPGKILKSEDDFEKAIQPERTLPDSVQGVIVRARTDPDHWLAAGAAPTMAVPLSGSAIYTPIRQDKGVNAATFAGPDQLLASGYLWEENRKQLAYKPFVIVQPEGRGTVIAFTADPGFRAIADGLNILLLNAVFRGPAHARPMGGTE
ncbi:MAG: peptidase M14, partial [Acidobacteria bacterium]|nr:peptidase M14 [Acidobacteriota bacterium]